ncbi:transposase [Streptomyces olivaceus]|uniref:transposase n=1 Tax=Streptomyces olivaceus TaxID=47716 RepID=UPI0037F67709
MAGKHCHRYRFRTGGHLSVPGRRHCTKRSSSSDRAVARIGRGGTAVPLTDARWARVEPLLPDRTTRRGGRWRSHREVIDAITWKFQTRQAVPVRNFRTVPFGIRRSSGRFRPRNRSGSNSRTNSHSASGSSRRHVTTP